jgi:large subunit ribosomal protein L23
MAILIKPIITEKMSAISEELGQYGFYVDVKASKPEIIAEVEKMYGVNVTNISTMIQGGKRKSRYTKAGFVNGKKPNRKKAIVTLREGQSIDFYESI